MPACSYVLTKIKDAYDASGYWWIQGEVNKKWLVSHSTSSFNQTYRDNVLQAIARLYSAVEYLIYANLTKDDPKYIPYYLENCVGGGEVDMDTIINTMLTANFNQLQKFIGIEDAYRVALWNAPFNADFYAALARGFQTWP